MVGINRQRRRQRACLRFVTGPGPYRARVAREGLVAMVETIVIILAVLVVLGVIAAGRSVRVVQQFEQGIVFRFGRIQSRCAARD